MSFGNSFPHIIKTKVTKKEEERLDTYNKFEDAKEDCIQGIEAQIQTVRRTCEKKVQECNDDIRKLRH